jgi:NAD(P)H-hydrate epimerase
MERAGRAVARAAIRVAGGAYGRRVLVVCGRGNNAGDGFVAARHLAAWGAVPVVALLNDPAEVTGDALTNLQRLRGVRTLPVSGASFLRELGRSDIVVDALFGTGFRGSLSGPAAQAVEAVNASGRPVVAVDIPSGVDGAGGRVEGPAIRATVTVTMGALKPGLLIHPGSGHAGAVEVADIGIAVPSPPAVMGAPDGPDVAAVLGHRPPDAHKRSVGTVMIVAGSVGMSGAACLSASGALRTGAGLVTMATVSSIAREVDHAVLEATTLPLPETPAGTISAAAVEVVLGRASTVDAIAIGPGLTTHAETVEAVRKLVAGLELPLVLDADGLNALAGDAGTLASRSAPTIITPHPGELSRLLGTSSAAIQADRPAAASKAARQLNVTVVLKGYRSIVAGPAGEMVIITTGGPGLATGGTGDVLTGVTVALLAGKTIPFAAAWAASWLHGRAGDVLERKLGDRGVVAGDLPAALPGVMLELGTGSR